MDSKQTFNIKIYEEFEEYIFKLFWIDFILVHKLSLILLLPVAETCSVCGMGRYIEYRPCWGFLFLFFLFFCFLFCFVFSFVVLFCCFIIIIIIIIFSGKKDSLRTLSRNIWRVSSITSTLIVQTKHNNTSSSDCSTK